MRIITLLFILCLILTASCRRKGDASGRVFNILTNEPIAGIGVNLDEYKYKMISSSEKARGIANTNTNSKGEYSFQYGPKLGAGYNRIITLDRALFDEMDTSVVLDKKYDFGSYPGCEKTEWDYSGHSRTNQDFYLAPLARVKVVPHNISHIYDGVTLRIDLFDDNYSKLAGYYDKGNITNTNFYTQFPSNGRINIVWQLQGSIFQNFYDTIHVAPFEKVTYHFNY